ncbi:MAG TPA: class I SAM-dependent methyltransferase [Gaiellaceae bacterium]
MGSQPEVPGHYSAHYRDFAADVYGDVRREAFGLDIGQNSWLTVEELERFGSLLELRPSSRLLDVACGSGGPMLHLVRPVECEAVGVELYEEAVATGRRKALDAGLEERVTFVCADASRRLPFESESFDAVLCVDAINHLPDRRGVVSDWARLLRPGGRVLFTDPIVLTGPLSSEEIATRASIGYLLFLPPGENERVLTEAGLEVVSVDDTTEHLAEIARRRFDARANHAAELVRVEGEHAFDGRQRFFDLVATLARQRRLSRLVYAAARPI